MFHTVTFYRALWLIFRRPETIYWKLAPLLTPTRYLRSVHTRGINKTFSLRERGLKFSDKKPMALSKNNRPSIKNWEKVFLIQNLL